MENKQKESLLAHQHFFFDLDGTLSDSRQDVLGGIAQAYGNLGLEYDESKLKIGPLLPDIIRAISPQLTQEQQVQVMTTFRAIYMAGKYRNTVLFPFVREALQKLVSEGKTLYVATNKPYVPTMEVLEKLEVKDMFLYVGTPDGTGEQMTKPEVLKMMVSMFDLEPSSCVMVGDTLPDLEAGRYAGMHTMAFMQGYGDVDLLRKEADYILDSYQELL